MFHNDNYLIILLLSHPKDQFMYPHGPVYELTRCKLVKRFKIISVMIDKRPTNSKACVVVCITYILIQR